MALTERDALPPRTFPKTPLFGKVVELRSRESAACGPTGDAHQASFSGKSAEVTCPMSEIRNGGAESGGVKNFEGLGLQPSPWPSDSTPAKFYCGERDSPRFNDGYV